MPIATAQSPTAAAARCRSGFVSFFESRIPRRCSGADTTAPTVTGPAQAPRPTSSMPTTTRSPACQHRRSSRKVGVTVVTTVEPTVRSQKSSAKTPPHTFIRPQRARDLAVAQGS